MRFPHQVPIFLNNEQLCTVEQLASEREWTRSHMLRFLVLLGLETLARRERRAKGATDNRDDETR